MSEASATRVTNIQGMRFGRLLVLERAGSNKFKELLWRCVCDCGRGSVVPGRRLRRGHAMSCGCYAKDRAVETHTVHGMTGSKIHKIWMAMLHRCGNTNNRYYKDYGGRGITVCERWTDFRNFYADMGDKPTGRSIDRINNDGNYEPGNCRWATPKEQSNNTRRQKR